MDLNTVWSRYQELYDEEAAESRARIAEEDAEEYDEEGGGTEDAEDPVVDGAKYGDDKVKETSRVAETLYT